MEWTKDKSTGLSIICVYIFALLLLAADISAPFLLEWSNRLIPSDPSHGVYALITLYSASVFAWICLYGGCCIISRAAWYSLPKISGCFAA